jgi:hypothetical protein
LCKLRKTLWNRHKGMWKIMKTGKRKDNGQQWSQLHLWSLKSRTLFSYHSHGMMGISYMLKICPENTWVSCKKCPIFLSALTKNGWAQQFFHIILHTICHNFFVSSRVIT